MARVHWAVMASKKPTRTSKKKTTTQAKKPAGAEIVLYIVAAPDPLAALKKYAGSLSPKITKREAETLLGAAALVIGELAEEFRGERTVDVVTDVVFGLWSRLPDPAGFHAQDFLRHAAGEIVDPTRLGLLAERVPAHPSPELLFHLAGGFGRIGDRGQLLATLERALAAGVSPAQVQREPDLARYVTDPDVVRLLAARKAPAIPVDLAPHGAALRKALDQTLQVLKKYQRPVDLSPPARLDDVLAAEAATGIQLPNDYRALLTLHDGLVLHDRRFFGTRDLRGGTPLHGRAREYIEMSSDYGAQGIEDCVPLANWGQPNDWLLYDPVGRTRGGEPGYVIMLNADESPQQGLAQVLLRLARLVESVYGEDDEE
jgi:hypothetical protein